MTDRQSTDSGNTPEVMPEVRTRRLVVVNEAGAEQAVVELTQDLVELRLGGSQAAMPCKVVVFAGEDEPGHFAAGVELWANGESVRWQLSDGGQQSSRLPSLRGVGRLRRLALWLSPAEHRSKRSESGHPLARAIPAFCSTTALTPALRQVP